MIIKKKYPIKIFVASHYIFKKVAADLENILIYIAHHT